ncbi:MAG: sel1 repeat family protein [Betaproteobacteria bacterium]|nr:MAG: sel1 repeat family protein [Betaproteobacteria bacterium]
MSRSLAGALLILALAGAPLHAEQTISVDELKIRSEAGDKTATRALAEAYYVGRGGVAQDFAQAAHWYRKLASQGEAAAQTSLGLMHARGLGFPKNMAEARKWWSLAAAQNDPGAQHNLGMVYLEGAGVAVDAPQALHWFQRAAARGHVLAQRMVGLMHFEGKGTPRDELTGITWLKIAADNGEEGAQETLKIVSRRVSADLLATAAERAAEWRAGEKQRDAGKALRGR